VLLAILVFILVGGGAAPVRAADAVDFRAIPGVLDPARCQAASAAAVARLPERCFVAVDDVPEPAGNTYITPPRMTFRFVVPPLDGHSHWILHLDSIIDRGMLDDISPSGETRSQTPIGMEIPVAQRAVHTYDDRVPLPASVRAGDTLVLTFQASRVRLVTFELRTTRSLRALDDADAATYYGPLTFLNGMLLAMALFNILLYALLRKRYYLLYSLSMLAMIAFETIQSGVAWTLVWPGLSVRDDAPAYVVYVVYFALVTAFARSFLALPEVSVLADRVLLVALGVLALDALLYVGFPGLLAAHGLWPFVDPFSVTLMLGALLGAGIVAWKKNALSARYYVIGFGGAALGLLLGEAADYGLITLGVWHDLCSELGVAWEAIFLAFALAERIRVAEREAARLTDYAYRDQLTGVSNRRSFDETLENEWRRSARSGNPLSLLMFDIDHFKVYNDRFGHQQGDWALRAVALEIARAARRPGDFAARYGGEEFALVLSETSADGAFLAAQTIRRSIRALGIAFDDTSLTVSVGCATLVPTEESSAAELIAAADAALYEAKGAGRDRTVAATTS
jgi:diguanylate cyclase (GGDEF)-like protein